VKYAPVVSEEDEEEMEYDAEADDSEELDLEAVIKELELEIAESDESDEDLEEEAVEETVNITEEEDEDEDEKEVDEQSTPESEEDTEVHESVNAMQTELNEYKEAVTYLRDKLHEVNILNAKLLYTNRLFKEFALSNNQKMKIVETFDRAQTTREIKLVYSTLAESYSDTGSVKKNEIKEFASKKAGTTAPKTKIISEENQVADRFKKLAGILND
jgi:prophage DNA circulation protein